MEIWQYNYGPARNDELYHWGIKGMKWGVRRFQNPDGTLTAQGKQRYKDYKSDQSTRRSLTRHVAADKKNLKARGEAMNEVRKNYDEAEEQMRKASSKVFISRKKRDALIDEASSNLTKAGEELEKRQADLNRAERIYNKDAEALFKHVDDMTRKYGSDNVKSLDTKKIKLGEYYTIDAIKTGITVADMPLVGRWYSGNYTSRQEYEDRRETIKRLANDRY